MGHIKIFMDENKPKSYLTDRWSFNNCIIVVRVIKIVEIWLYSCKYSQTKSQMTISCM